MLLEAKRKLRNAYTVPKRDCKKRPIIVTVAWPALLSTVPAIFQQAKYSTRTTQEAPYIHWNQRQVHALCMHGWVKLVISELSNNRCLTTTYFQLHICGIGSKNQVGGKFFWNFREIFNIKI